MCLALRAFSAPLVDQIGPMPYTAAPKLLDDVYPPGLRNYWKSNFVKELTDDAIDTMEALREAPAAAVPRANRTPVSGAVSQINREATAFNHQDATVAAASIGECTSPADAEKCFSVSARVLRRCNHTRPVACTLTISVKRPTRAPIGYGFNRTA